MRDLLRFVHLPVQFGSAANEFPRLAGASCTEDFEFLAIKFVVGGKEKLDLRNGLFFQSKGLQFERGLFADRLPDNAIVPKRPAIFSLGCLYDSNRSNFQKTAGNQGFFV